MTIKKLFVLGSALAGAAYLRDPGRRQRLFGQARGLLDKVRGTIQSRIESKRGESLASSHDANETHANSSDYGDAGIRVSRTYP